MERLRTFDEIIFDILIGVYSNISIEFLDIKERIKFYLELQRKNYDSQITVDVTTLTRLDLYKNDFSFRPDVIYRQVSENEFIEVLMV